MDFILPLEFLTDFLSRGFGAYPLLESLGEH